MPSRVDRVLSQKPVKEEDLLAAMNWEILPALRALLDAHNNSVGPVSSAITSDETIDGSSQYYLVDTSSGDVDIALPPAQGWELPIVVKIIDASNTTQLVPFGSDTIEGAGGPSGFGGLSSLTLVSDGDSGWWEVGSR